MQKTANWNFLSYSHWCFINSLCFCTMQNRTLWTSCVPEQNKEATSRKNRSESLTDWVTKSEEDQMLQQRLTEQQQQSYRPLQHTGINRGWLHSVNHNCSAQAIVFDRSSGGTPHPNHPDDFITPPPLLQWLLQEEFKQKTCLEILNWPQGTTISGLVHQGSLPASICHRMLAATWPSLCYTW